jgi:hypothetical protein
MKTGKYITAMLMALIIGNTAVQAQTAVRPDSRENKERANVKRSGARENTSEKSRAIQPARQPAAQPANRPANRQVERQRSTQPTPQQAAQPANRPGNPQAERQRSSQPSPSAARSTVQREAAKQKVAQRERPVSISTPHNPESHYRSPDPNRNAKQNKYSDKLYYSGHHYHPVYPRGKVKVYYHPDTYLHNYHVLYYPAYAEIYWTRNMYSDYCSWYPNYYWRYDYGHRIQTISVFDAKYNLGEVAMVYGRVYATWHNRDTDDYLLFFGGDYPYQQFTVVLPGHIARKFSWRPEQFFLGVHLTITGLITTFDGIPEIIVKNRRQVATY